MLNNSPETSTSAIIIFLPSQKPTHENTKLSLLLVFLFHHHFPPLPRLLVLAKTNNLFPFPPARLGSLFLRLANSPLLCYARLF